MVRLFKDGQEVKAEDIILDKKTTDLLLSLLTY